MQGPAGRNLRTRGEEELGVRASLAPRAQLRAGGWERQPHHKCSWRLSRATSASTISAISASSVVSGSPAEALARLGRVAQHFLDLRRPHEARVHDDMILHLEAGVVERERAELAHRGGASGRDHIVVRLDPAAA